VRLGVIMVVGGLAACDVNNGTYVAVDGEQVGITFDKVEFFESDLPLARCFDGLDLEHHPVVEPQRG